jgi:peptidoglycan hydrolase-like amidase/peptidoglycan hydrolase CwlO-like protein
MPMKKILALFFFTLFLGFFFFVNTPRIFSDELDDINKQINELTSALSQSVKATQPLEEQANAIRQRISAIERDLVAKEKNIENGYANLAKQQEILNATIRDYYVKSYYNSPLLILLSSNSAAELTQALGYQKANANRDKAIIVNIAITIQDLQQRKKDLEEEKTNIATAKAKLDKIIGEAKTYQGTLTKQLAELSAKQQQILAQRLANLNIPLYAYNTQGGCSSDIGKDPGFSGGFGFFSYGVPNRVGLNQYGAWGRAKAGQGYEQILRAYYNFDAIETRSATINVDGYGSYSLDDYVKRVYEVPDSWIDNDLAALKAQAIAARSYALAYTNNGSGSICTTQQCQVFKPDPKGGNWEQAVNATAGTVMIQGGSPIKAWFSSTHGGYIFSSGDIGWSQTSWTKNSQDASGSINSFDDLKNNAYDKDSPWFYCDWGTRSEYNKTAWLKPEEVADIVNVILLMQKDSGARDHLYQIDKSNPAGTDTWDQARVRQELQNRGSSPFSNISGISVSVDFSSGRTTNVHVSGDAGSVDISASDFKNYFNLRAPASIQIVGPLYNIERE